MFYIRGSQTFSLAYLQTSKKISLVEKLFISKNGKAIKNYNHFWKYMFS